MLDLDRRGRDLRAFVAALEGWIITALAEHGIAAGTIAGKVGVWVESAAGPAKIAAIGVRVRRWVSFHGLSINVAPDLAHFSGIVPCGLSEPITSVAALRGSATMVDVDKSLAATLPTMLAALPHSPAGSRNSHHDS
jgi:lipoyl(octanoyl) transferase